MRVMLTRLPLSSWDLSLKELLRICQLGPSKQVPIDANQMLGLRCLVNLSFQHSESAGDLESLMSEEIIDIVSSVCNLKRTMKPLRLAAVSVLFK